MRSHPERTDLSVKHSIIYAGDIMMSELDLESDLIRGVA